MAALLVAGGAPRAFSQTFDITTTPGNAIIPSSTFTAVRVATPNVSVGGSVINTGTVNAAATGILINNNATLVGGLTNNGVVDLSSKNGILVNGATIVGGILNSGTITNSNTGAGITVTNVSTFGGGISNSATIDVGGNGIFVGPTLSGGPVSTFSGGISNSGVISAGGASAAGIAVQTIQTFIGNITNAKSGTISAGHTGIVVNEHVNQFVGNIVNMGAITAVSGIVVGCGCGVSTFAGSISNNGTITAAAVGILVTNVEVFGTSAAGGVTNSGTITAGIGGIVVTNVHTFGTSAAGGITNSGEIFVAATSGRGIIVAGVSSFTGPILNTGMISATGAGAAGIEVQAVRNFAGSIVNDTSGTITASGPGGVGIVVGNFTSPFAGVSNFSGNVANRGTITAGSIGIFIGPVSTFTGNVTNSGSISAWRTGIVVADARTFTGDISNSGMISATLSAGIFVGGTSLATGVRTFNGDIINSGKIIGGGSGIAVADIGTFTGNVVNSSSGTISASGAGISISDSHTFIGNVSNGGLITAGTGIAVGCSCGITNFTGEIVNSGNINATRTGILIQSISTFAGGITNTGTVSGASGIVILGTSGVSIFDSGTIIGSGGTAIQFASGTNTLTLGPGFNIQGNVLGAGADTFQLGGSGTGAFNLSNIGTQYTGFTTFNVISANWVATGTGNQNWNISSGATLQLGDGVVADGGAITGNVLDNGTFAIDRADTYTFAGTITGSGSFVQMGSGTTVLNGANGYGGGTTIAAGTLQVGNSSAVGTGPVMLDGGIFQAGAAGLPFANTFVIDAGTGTIDTQANTLTLSGSISDGIGSIGGLTKIGGGTLVLTGTSGYTGATNVNAGTLQAGAASVFAPQSLFNIASGATLDLNGFSQTLGSLAGAGNVTLGSGTLTAGGNNASTTYSGAISGSGGFNKAGSGTLLLTGTSDYTGVTNIDGGTFEVDGAITSSSSVNVNAGSTLTGVGTVDPSTVTIGSGSNFVPGTAGVPGTSMTIAGNLAFQSGALYLVYLNQATSTFANVTGAAALAGTVQAMFSLGSVAAKQYTILQSAGLNGTTFAGVTAPPNFTGTLSYSADDVFLKVSAALGLGTALNQNQQSAANAINAFFNGGGALPAGFINLFGQTGNGLAATLTRLDGENATGAEHVAFELTNEFLGLMLDPFVYGRGGAASGGGPLGFAPDRQASFPSDVALAYAGLLKAPPRQSFDQRWTVWGASFGGSGTFNGDPAVGSNNVTASTYGFAAGADYHVDANTVLGFAAAGSGTNWSLAQSLGTGRSDAFQAGVYGTRYFGPAYVSAALAFINNWFTTNRIAAAGDQLTASFNGQSFGARVESGYRYAVAPAMGVTPYAAIQAQDFHTPTYNETDLTGGGFGLTYAATTATDTRSELGARFDALTAWGAMPMQLRARLAWAHDWVSNAALDAAFQALPGSSFVVNGAAVPANSALASVGAELHLTPRWTLIGKFDGEFASSAQTYAGSGTLRYQW
ncbi:MAG: autotransporter domain-containing protein [Xanthobacteraceae bacterium]